jgi:hypothetical protein
MKELIRFTARVAVTPILVWSFGLFALGFLCFLGPAFAFISFLQGETFSWPEFRKEVGEFFMEPLQAMWGRRAA